MARHHRYLLVGDVDAAEGVGRGLQDALALGPVGDVGGHAHHLPAGGRDLGQRLGGAAFALTRAAFLPGESRGFF